MTFGRWDFAATSRRADELGYSAFFVVSAVAAGSVVSSVPAADSGELVASSPELREGRQIQTFGVSFSAPTL
jgi:hypothetical protein